MRTEAREGDRVLELANGDLYRVHRPLKNGILVELDGGDRTKHLDAGTYAVEPVTRTVIEIRRDQEGDGYWSYIIRCEDHDATDWAENLAQAQTRALSPTGWCAACADQVTRWARLVVDGRAETSDLDADQAASLAAQRAAEVEDAETLRREEQR